MYYGFLYHLNPPPTGIDLSNRKRVFGQGTGGKSDYANVCYKIM